MALALHPHAPSARPLRGAKFGGGVMAGRSDVQKSIDIAVRRGYDLSVVSALSGATQHLIDSCAEARSGLYGHSMMMAALANSHFDQFKKLNDGVHQDADTQMLHEQLYAALHFISSRRGRLSSQSFLALQAHVLGFGERLSALSFSKLSGFKLLRPEDVQFRLAGPNPTSAKPAGCQITPAHLEGNQVVFPGYYGLYPAAEGGVEGWEGELFGVMGRGASDLTLAVLARALYDTGHYRADGVQIDYYKNVSHFMSADPQIVREAAVRREHMTFFEVSSLDSKNLDPRSAQQLDGTAIVARIVPFGDPGHPGTRIAQGKPEGANGFSISQKPKCLLTIRDANMVDSVGFLMDALAPLRSESISFDDLTTASIVISFTVDRGDGERALSALRQAGFDPQLQSDVTVVSPVTDLLRLARLDHVVSDVLGQLDIHNLMRNQAQGGEPRVLVRDADAAPFIRALHARLLNHS
ncbi:MAG: aspartate kinase [Candidatus Micrarchaeota archaeon]|nr:aspartate kinase [Candidatus Micrarchaeota archaeon]